MFNVLVRQLGHVMAMGDGRLLSRLAIEAVTYFFDGVHLALKGGCNALVSNGQETTPTIWSGLVDRGAQSISPRLFSTSAARIARLPGFEGHLL